MTNLFYRQSQSKRGVELNLPAEITRQASKQSYYTFRFLVERQRRQTAFRAYAYFRWLDDQLDCNTGTFQEKLDLIKRQGRLLDACYRRDSISAACPEEQMLVDLVSNDHEETSGLQIYLRNMMAVMSFDVQRKGQLITQAQLTHYSSLLSMAVTDLMFYLIDHDSPLPRNTDRYQAVQGAHIAHMLRDMLKDIAVGYINLPSEVIEADQISLPDLHSLAFRSWVMERVRLARQCFYVGRQYFAQVKNLRCRLAASAYLARFEWMLGAIERDGYFLRPEYPERKSLRAGFWMAWSVFRTVFNLPIMEKPNRQLAMPD